MSEDLPIQDGIVIPGWEIWFTASRAGGPGGQHVNTSSTRVTLHWVPANTSALSEADKARVVRSLANRLTTEGELLLHASEYRSQKRNREAARERLVELVRAGLVRRKRRRKTRPSRGAIERRLSEKKRRAAIKKKRGKPEPGDH